MALRCTILFAMLVASSALSASKLSIHVNGVDGGMSSWLSGAQPRLVKLLDPSPSDVAAVRANVPDAFIVGRIYSASQPMIGDPSAAADAWMSANLATIQACAGVNAWEGYNEPAADYDSLVWYSQFEIARIAALASYGFNASVGQFSVGSPDVTNATVITAFLPAIAAAYKAGGVLALHEYSSPFMWSCYSNSSGNGWTTGRYRMLYDQFLIPAGIALPLVVSEGGIDNTPCGGPNSGGWLTYCGYWASAGYGNDCPATYVQQLAWYDSIMRQDAYVIGATLFCYHCDGFDAYEVQSALPDLQTYMNAQ